MSKMTKAHGRLYDLTLSPMSFIRRYFREPFPGISHLLGAVLSVAGLVVLIYLSRGRPYHVVGFAIYGGSLVLLYAASALCHSLPVDEQGEIKLDRFDRCAIFCLIAGTYTPICLLAPALELWGWSLLGIEWGVAAIGISGILWGPPCARWLRTVPYVIMGWLAIVAISPLQTALPPAAAGMALRRRSRLFPGSCSLSDQPSLPVAGQIRRP